MLGIPLTLSAINCCLVTFSFVLRDGSHRSSPRVKPLTGILPLISVHTSASGERQIFLHDSTVEKIGEWHGHICQRGRGSETLREGVKKAPSSGSRHLSQNVEPPPECHGVSHGDAEVVVLCGEETEIEEWLDGCALANGKDLANLVSPADGLRETKSASRHTDDKTKIAESMIFCLLADDDVAQARKTLYLIIRLHPGDRDSMVHQLLLRVALEMSPSWLVFYNHQAISEEGFARPHLPADCQQMKVAPGLRVDVIQQLKETLKSFHCQDGRGDLISLVHLHFVMGVPLKFFTDVMVDKISPTIPLCTKKTEHTLKPESAASLRTDWLAICRREESYPFVDATGVSLRHRLHSSNVRGHRVLLDQWLHKWMGFIPVVLMTSRMANAPESVRVQMPISGVVCQTPNTNGQVESAPTQLGKAMDMSLPGHLSEILPTWPGRVQVVGAIGMNGRRGAQFLDQIAGSPFFPYIYKKIPDANNAASELCRPKAPARLQRAQSMPAAISSQASSSGAERLHSWQKQKQKQKKTESQSARPFAGSKPQNRELPPSLQETPLPQSGNEAMAQLLPVHHYQACGEAKLWVCCRRSSSTLHVLLALEGVSLEAAADSSADTHASALLVAVACLTNLFIVNIDGMDAELKDNVLTRLSSVLERFGRHLPPSEDTPDLLKGKLVLTSETAIDELTKTEVSSEHRVVLSKNFRSKINRDTMKSLDRFFSGGITTAYNAKWFATIRQLMQTCGCSYKSSLVFQGLLKMVLATMTMGRLEVMKLQVILDQEYNRFEEDFRSVIEFGKPDKAGRAHSKRRTINAQLGGRDIPLDDLSDQTKNMVLYFGFTQETSDVNVEGVQTRPKLNVDQRATVKLVVHHISRANAAAREEDDTKASPKRIAPSLLFEVVEKVIGQLVACRQDQCRAWVPERLEQLLFNTEDELRDCEQLIRQLSSHWKLCGERCNRRRIPGENGESSKSVSRDGDGCYYLCLLPTLILISGSWVRAPRWALLFCLPST